MVLSRTSNIKFNQNASITFKGKTYPRIDKYYLPINVTSLAFCAQDKDTFAKVEFIRSRIFDVTSVSTAFMVY
jgi:hypothetical protein